jgi:transcriptional regulator with XRE-family HTH domain
MPPPAPLVDDLPTVADLVRAALDRKNLSIRDAASRTEGRLSHSQIARILRGQSAQCQPETLRALSDALGIPITKLRKANGAHNGRVPTVFILPERANELNIAERRVVVNMIGALLAAHDSART